MTIAVSRETLGYRGAEGSIAYGLGREVLSGQGATVTLTPAQAGSLVLFDSAAGHIFTLPAVTTATIGMFFDFAVKTSVTSNNHKIITDAATTFLVGAVVMASIATASPAGFSANGTTIRALTANGTTTGGLIGETYRVVALSTTQWQISGVSIGSGTLATPFATS
jgi:hypothetical protein